MPHEQSPISFDVPLSPEPVVGDGIVTLPAIEGDFSMANFDLPPGIAAQLASETGGNIQAANLNGRAVFQQASGVLAGKVTRILEEPSVIGSRAVSGVLATPIAPPTTQG